MVNIHTDSQNTPTSSFDDQLESKKSATPSLTKITNKCIHSLKSQETNDTNCTSKSAANHRGLGSTACGGGGGSGAAGCCGGRGLLLVLRVVALRGLFVCRPDDRVFGGLGHGMVGVHSCVVARGS